MPEQDVGTPEKECANMEDKIVKIINEMAEYLNVAQMKKLQEVLLQTFSESEAQKEQISNEEYLKLFLDAKKIEGCSERTIQYYRVTVERLLQTVDTPLRKMTTEEIRRYLVEYQKINNCGKVTSTMCAGIFPRFLVAGRRGLHPQKPPCAASIKSRPNSP